MSNQVVFSIHGIRTRGEWQKGELGRQLSARGFTHVALDYGFLSALKLLMPCFRRRHVDWFRSQYEHYRPDGDRNYRPSVIAHSFGTYLVARSMEKYEEIEFDRIILCGSIVPRDYDWATRIDKRQCTDVLNDYGQIDFWAKIAKFVIRDAGDSGVKGFTSTRTNLIQRCHPEFRHSDYFYQLNYEKNWIPFLLGEPIAELTNDDRASVHKNPHFAWTFGIVMTVALIAFGLLVWTWWTWEPAGPRVDNTSFEQMAADYNSDEFVSGLENYRHDHDDRQVTWDAVVHEVVPGGYRLRPIPDELSDFKALAKYDPADPVLSLQAGDKVKIQAIIDDINAAGVILKEMKLIERYESVPNAPMDSDQ